MSAIRLSAGQLHINMTLPWDVFDMSGKLLLRRGFLIEREAQIDLLLDRGMFVQEEDFKRHPLRSSNDAPPQQKFDPFWLWEEIPTKLGRLLRNIDNEPEFAAKVGSLANLVLLLCEKNADAALAAIQLLDSGKYALTHALHVAVLCDLIARRQGWDKERRHMLACAALTMNVGMLDLQSILAMQKTPPTPEQRAGIEAHPALGRSILEGAGVTNPAWLRAVQEHHEAPDGTGYPGKISDMSEEALVLRTADIFSAKIAPRATRQGMTADQAAKALFVQEGEHHNTLTGLLIKEVGIFPPGCFVKLANGETAVVARRGAAVNTPIVYSFVNGQGVPMLEPVKRDCTQPNHAVAAVIQREKVIVALDLNKIWNPAVRG